MTTPNQYSVIDSEVYSVDLTKEGLDFVKRSGDTFFEYEDNSGQQYKILNTVDTNDKYNSQGYAKNGFQGMVVAPVINGQPDYANVIVAFAGTNATDWHLNDLSADLSNVTFGFERDGNLDSQFTSAQQFYDETARIYGANNIEAVTGHSLGGALAQKVAATNHIPAVTFSSAGVGSQLTKAEKAWINGKGKQFILNFMHKGDQVSSWTDASKYGTTIYAGDFGGDSLLSGHFLTSYRFDKNGSLIDDTGETWNITDKGILKSGIDIIQNDFKAILNDLNTLKRKFLASGGGLSTNEKIYLDDAQAFAVASTAGTEYDLSMVNLMNVYKNGIKRANEIWDERVSQSRQAGSLLDDREIHEALEMVGFTHKTIVEIPTEQYQAKIDKIRQMSDNFKSLESEIKTKISELVSRDAELAQQLRP